MRNTIAHRSRTPVFGLLLGVGWLIVQGASAFAQSSTTDRIQERTYKFEEAGGRDSEYSLFVPSTYDGSERAPLIVALHGKGGNNSMMIRYEGLTDFAERDGYIVAAPMGANGAYGFIEGEPTEHGLTTGELSEKDVMNVLEIVTSEFNIDKDRIYLMGHSMGGYGTYHIGAKYNDIWAALVPIAGGVISVEQGEKLKHIPILVLQGGADRMCPAERSRESVARMKELGMEHLYVEVPGASHRDGIWSNPAMMSRVISFFNIVSKRGARD